MENNDIRDRISYESLPIFYYWCGLWDTRTMTMRLEGRTWRYIVRVNNMKIGSGPLTKERSDEAKINAFVAQHWRSSEVGEEPMIDFLEKRRETTRKLDLVGETTLGGASEWCLIRGTYEEVPCTLNRKGPNTKIVDLGESIKETTEILHKKVKR